jgi:arsenate reductase
MMADVIEVLFVCQHGAAKSVIAARHLEELARARGMTIHASAAGMEPDETIPPHVIAGLRADGVDDREGTPPAATPDLIASADIVVAFGCDLAALAPASDQVIQWSGVPAVSDGYDAARTAILSRLDAILDDVERRAGMDQPE